MFSNKKVSNVDSDCSFNHKRIQSQVMKWIVTEQKCQENQFINNFELICGEIWPNQLTHSQELNESRSLSL